MPTKAEKLEKIEAQIKKLKAREQKIKSADRAAERKLDTRRKVIIGGLLLDAAEKDESYGRVIDALMKRMTRDADKDAFKDWEKPSPSSGGETPSPSPAAAAPPPARPRPRPTFDAASSGGADPSPPRGGGSAG